MRKFLMIALLAVAGAFSAIAQKTAVVDMK